MAFRKYLCPIWCSLIMLHIQWKCDRCLRGARPVPVQCMPARIFNWTWILLRVFCMENNGDCVIYCDCHINVTCFKNLQVSLLNIIYEFIIRWIRRRYSHSVTIYCLSCLSWVIVKYCLSSSVLGLTIGNVTSYPVCVPENREPSSYLEAATVQL